MSEEVVGLTLPPDLTAWGRQGHRQRASLPRVAASMTGTAGISAAVAIGPTVASAAPDAVRAGSGAAKVGGQAVRSPQGQLMAGTTTSAQLSYRMHLVNRSALHGRQMTLSQLVT
jgi:hypothetical protein